MKSIVWTILIAVLLAGCAVRKSGSAFESVNPFIGTGGHGHTYPGATWPFGMVQLSPDTRLDGWDGCSGYHHSDSVIYGFSHTHLQGTGVADYCDILFSPTNSTARAGSVWRDRYSSRFSKRSEFAEPSYYRVGLDDFELQAELTCTPRVGVHRYTLNSVSDSLTLFIDMSHRDELKEYSFYPLNDSTIVGHRVSSGWASEQHIYFVARFSEPFDYMDQTFEMRITEDTLTGIRTESMELVPVFPLVFKKAKSVIALVALSGTSIEGALSNLKAEAPHFDFERYRLEAADTWKNEIGRIEISGGSADQRSSFYSALYHTFTVPNVWADADGHYRGADHSVHESDSASQYTIFSLWDTYRATHPLYTIVQRNRTKDFIQSFLNFYDQSGRLPVWELAANETDCMIGYHSASVIADAHSAGIRGFDLEKALAAVTQSAEEDRLGKKAYRTQGYISSEDEPESVSKTLEYAYDDRCIAQLAEAAGNTQLANEFNVRAQSWQNIFDPATGHVRAKRGGRWVEPFDPSEVNFHFTEANAWQYTFHTPHDIMGMTKLYGDSDKMLSKLEALFQAESQMAGREQPDITGLIGQYAHGNEPSHHVAFLFNYLGQPSRTQQLTRKILTEFYHNTPDGLSGNEDCGQMSAWYVLAASGLYKVAPGNDVWTLTTPLFSEIKFNLENGKQFVIKAINNSAENIYIKSVHLNGSNLKTLSICHGDIMAGGELVFTLGSEPNDAFDWQSLLATSSIPGSPITTVPVFSGERAFTDSTEVSLNCPDTKATIHISVNGEAFEIYNEPFMLSEPADMVAYTESPGQLRSAQVATEFSKRNPELSITASPMYNSQYPAGGPDALIDGLRGGSDFRTGEWQGWWGTDAEITIDLGILKPVKRAALRCIQDVRPWIWLPRKVTVSVSEDGIMYIPVGFGIPAKKPEDYNTGIEEIGSQVQMNARYVRFQVEGFGSIPEWHLGAGNPSWFFADEIVIE